ncbi:MAG: (Fe-S)-binding protein [Gammaproteobacteria bacterium]|nr:(Fe-S)-binding protein [Gammaproteobacteria bacterium]
MSEFNVALFVTCLIDAYRPSVGLSAIELLERNGCRVEVPEDQTCCGQPALNNGQTKLAKDLAKQMIERFEGFDYVVGASGSCMGTVITHYPTLLAEDPQWQQRAEALAGKSYELLQFLTQVLQVQLPVAKLPKTITYHDSCSGLRELGIFNEPRELLTQCGHRISEMADSNVCCGFGGTFSLKYADISTKLAGDKVSNILNTGAKTVVAGDMGCLLNIAGKLQHQGHDIEVRHIAEVLVEATTPAIGATR